MIFQTMPLSSLTQRIVRDRYKAEFNKDQQMTGTQSETLRSVVVEVAKAEMNKGDSKSSKSKVFSLIESEYLIFLV